MHQAMMRLDHNSLASVRSAKLILWHSSPMRAECRI